MPDYQLKITVSAVSKNKEELAKAKDQLDGIKAGGESASAELKKMASQWAGNVLAAGTFIEAGKQVIQLIKASVVAFAEAELALAKRDAQFQSANGATRTSIVLLDSYAASLSQVLAVDDDMIVAQEEVLLQFRSISGEAIPKALRAAVDLAGGFRGNVIGSTEQLGRSLELIAQGGESASMAMNLLRRQGVILDAETRKQILTLTQLGRTEEAQIVLLNAVSDLMGGKAAAAANTLSGKWEITKNSAENLGEEIGSNLAPEIERQLKWINQSIQGWALMMQTMDRYHALVKEAGLDVGSLTNAESQHYMLLARMTPALEAEADAHEQVAMAIDPEIQATRELTQAKNLLTAGMAGELSSAFAQYDSDLKTAQIAQEEAIAGMLALDAKGVSPTSEAYQQFTGQLNQANGQILAANQGLQKQIALMIFHNAAAHLDAKGQLALAHSMGLISEQDYQVASSIEMLTEKFDTNGDGIVDATENVEDYVTELDKMRRILLGIPVEVTSTVTTNYVTTGTPPGGSGGGSGSGTCFLAGTPILMADGRKRAIESLGVGDSVQTWDFAENKLVHSTVTKVYHHEPAATSGYMVINGRIKVTQNHQLLVDGDWVQAATLRVGNDLDTPDYHETIFSISHFSESVPTFNLHVDHEDHNYIAHGVIAHNKDSEHAAGADFIVPPGFMNDTYNVGVQSGERVTVTPRDEVPQSYADSYSGGSSARGGPAGGIHIGTLIVNGGGITIEDMLYRIQMAQGEN